MLISIITINYNNKEGLIKTAASVMNQSYKNFEYLIIDGFSTDGSAKVVNDYKNSIAYAVSETDTGRYNAMNKGIRASKGEYLLFLNSGDTLKEDHVLEYVSGCLKSKKDIYYGKLEITHKNVCEIKEYPEKLSFNFFYNKGHLPHPSSFIKRTLFDEIYFYKEDFKIVADWDLFICAICKYNASYKRIDKVISKYTTDGISGDPKFANLSRSERVKSIKDNFPLFIDEAERLVEYDRKFKLNRFKMLDVLEGNPVAQKLNSAWLSLLTYVFKK